VTEPTLVLAFTAGVASFASPCMLPVIPAFFAQLAGTSLVRAQDLGRRHLLLGVFLFVGGFSLVFAVVGVALSAALEEVAAETLAWLSRLAGVVIITLGLHMTGLLRLPVLDRGYSARLMEAGPGRLAPLLFGASFAVAWTPCVGPVLGSTLALAAARPAWAFPLLLAYAVGLGTPFLLVGLFPSRGFELLRRNGRWAARLHVAFGTVLVGMGVLVFTGELDLLANFDILNEVLL
jgi:cytochrome c-type biogenesis protein